MKTIVKMLTVTMLLLPMLLCAESKTGYVHGGDTSDSVSFSSVADLSYTISASPTNGWVFTDHFSIPSGYSGWYKSAAHSASCETLGDATTVFVDAATAFGVTISGKMYKPGGTGGSLVDWSVSGSGSATCNPSIAPSSANIAYGDNEGFVYKINGDTAPSGMWRYISGGGAYSGNSASYTFPPSGANLEADSYVIYAARNSAGHREAIASVRYVGIDKLQSSISGGAYTDAPDALYVIPGASLSLKALPKPSGDWPDSNPDWSCSGNWIFGSHFIGASDNVDVVSMNTSDMGDVFTVTANCGSSEESVTVNVVEISLKSVDFTGSHAMKKTGSDDWSNDYYLSSGDTSITLEWQSSPSINEPVCYTKGASPTMTVTASASHSLSASSPVTFRVKKGTTTLATTSSVNFSGTETSKSGITWGTALPNNVENANKTLSWAVSGDGGTTYHDIGSNTTKFFVTYGTPSGSSATAKRLNWCTSTCDGKATPNAIADEIYSALSGSPPAFQLQNPNLPPNLWGLMDSATLYQGQCIQLAQLMNMQLNMLGYSGGSIGYVYGSSDTACFSTSSTAHESKSPQCPEHGEEKIFVWSAGGWNNWEAVCKVLNTCYAIKVAKGSAIEVLRTWLGSNTTNSNYQAWRYWDSENQVWATCTDPGPCPVPKP